MKPVPLGAAPTGAPYSPAVRFGTSDAFARRIQDARARGAALPTMADLAFDEQVHQTMANLKTTLESAGSSLDCLLQVTVFLRSQDDAARFDAIYTTYFADYFPARTRLQAGALPFDTAVEIEGIAYIPGQGF